MSYQSSVKHLSSPLSSVPSMKSILAHNPAPLNKLDHNALTEETSPQKIKRLTASSRREIELKNHARRLAGLSPIVVKVRTCNRCSRLFESSGNRNCGCQSKRSGFIAGREII